MPRAKVLARLEAKARAKAMLPWTRMLEGMIATYRRRNPADYRTDRQLTESLMEHFARRGLVKKGWDGKYVVPKLINPSRFVPPWDVELN
jgi:hypothetical protein